jgi:hypothetical protein
MRAQSPTPDILEESEQPEDVAVTSFSYNNHRGETMKGNVRTKKEKSIAEQAAIDYNAAEFIDFKMKELVEAERRIVGEKQKRSTARRKKVIDISTAKKKTA